MAKLEVAYSEHWQSGPENEARGTAWLDAIYKHNRTNTMKPLDAHKDFGKPLFQTLSLPSSFK